MVAILRLLRQRKVQHGSLAREEERDRVRGDAGDDLDPDGSAGVFAQKGTTGPTQTVVVNDAAQAVPVKMTGAAVSEPFAFTTSFAMTLLAQNSSSYVVPVTKRLVVEHVSASCSTLSQTQRARMAIIVNGAVDTAHYLKVDSIFFLAYHYIEASQPMKLYLNPGDNIHLWVNRSDGSNVGCTFNFSGYQVNAQ